MRKYMLYPFLYIQNYLRLRRNAKLKSITPMKVDKKDNRDLLKRTLKLKKKTTLIRSNTKFNSVVPDFVNPF